MHDKRIYIEVVLMVGVWMKDIEVLEEKWTMSKAMGWKVQGIWVGC